VKLVMTLLVRDEEDIIEANLRHHLAAGMDEIIVTDNSSVDGTGEILARFAAGGRVTILDEPGDDYSQSAWVTRMARIAAAELGADWVIHGDADEFYAALAGTLRDALASVPPDCGVVEVPRLNFEPVSGGSGPFYERMIVRSVRAANPLGQPLPAKVCHRADPEVVVGQGNHALTGSDWRTSAERPLLIYHYPMRSYGQFENKIRLGGAAYARNTRLPPSVGRTWRWLFDLYEDGRLREWYESRELSAEQIAAQVRCGEAVIDRRMAARLRATMP
jgi:glycosyltransferase involved in cell wall biosynthesis